MLTCLLQGGLGNQMFQISATTALAWRNGTAAAFNINSHHLPLQGRSVASYVDNIFSNVPFKEEGEFDSVAKAYYEKYYHHHPLEFLDGVCLVGYFQSEKYFIDFEDEIRNMFRCPPQTETYLMDKYGDLLSGETTSVHIRRGDYLKFSETHPPLAKEYYIKAMSKIPQTEKYLIFSDDVSWCLNNFKLDNFHVIGGEEDFIDLYLMSKCKNNIIANSSFSWWGAWLNNNSNKSVIAPHEWFGSALDHDTKDLIPTSWIKT